jgi:hypothetical protein
VSVQAFLARLREVKQNGSGWHALCPAHPDRNPSLSVRYGNGRILLHCFAGCTPEAICAALEIEMRELFSEPRAAHKPEPRIVRDARRQIISLRSRLTPRDRERAVTVVLATHKNLDAAIARALALAVEGELVQVVVKESE